MKSNILNDFTTIQIRIALRWSIIRKKTHSKDALIKIGELKKLQNMCDNEILNSNGMPMVYGKFWY